MGLDIYFYNRSRKLYTKEYTCGEVLDELNPVRDKEDFNKLFSRLKVLSENTNTPIPSIIYKAILDYLYREEEYNGDYEQIAYFRKFWYLLHFFGYADDDYGKDKLVTKEQIQSLKDKAEETIHKVISELTHLNYIVPTDIDIFVKTNLSESMEEVADTICESDFDNSDYWRVSEVYKQFKEILETTDFEKDQIVMNADW